MTRAGSTFSLGSVVGPIAGAGGAGLCAGRGGGGAGVASTGGASAVGGGTCGVSTPLSDNSAQEPSPNAAPKIAISRSCHFPTRRITATIVLDYTPAIAQRHQPVAYPFKLGQRIAPL
jgi:hypothetical protein